MRKSNNKIAYGIGNLGYSVISQTLTNFFMFFGTSVLKIGGTLMGVALTLSTFWDGFTDPFVGYLSDEHEFLGLGHRKGYMIVATFGMIACNLFIWFVPVNLSTVAKFLWITIGLLAIETFNTLFSTPYMALGTDLGTNYNDRTKLQISKTVFFLIGMIIPSLLLYIFLPNTVEYPVGQLNPYGYRKMSIVTSAICLVSGVMCVIFTNSPKRTVKEQGGTGIKYMFTSFLSVLKIKPIARLILGYAIVMLSGTILTSVGMHFFTYCFNLNSRQITLLLSSLLLGTLLSQPLWYHMSVSSNKKIALINGIFIAVVGTFVTITIFLLRYTLGENAFIFILISIFVCGVGTGALYTLPCSMFSDYVARQNKITHTDRTATYSGVLTFLSNVANSLMLLFVGIMLDAINFNPNNVEQTLGVQTGLAIMLFVGVQVSLIIGYYIFSGCESGCETFKNSKNSLH